MDYIIRQMKASEYPLLEDFLYEAIFHKENTEPVPRSILSKPELQVYIKDFGSHKDDHCFCAEVDNKIIGAVWVRVIDGYGHIDQATPEFAISLYKEYRGHGIGTDLMQHMLTYLKESGYSKASLAVQKENYAFRMYQALGFEIIDENVEEYIMVYRFRTDKN